MIIGLWQDIILFEMQDSKPKVPFAYYNERYERGEDSDCFLDSKEKVNNYLQRGFTEKVSGFCATHIFVSTWYGFDNGSGLVSSNNYTQGLNIMSLFVTGPNCLSN